MLHRQAWSFVLIVQNPAFALGDYMVTELVARHFIAPLTKCAFSKFLNIAFMHQRHRAPLVLDGMLNGHAHQSLGARNRNRFDANAGIITDSLLGIGQHCVVQEIKQLLYFRRTLFPFDSSINILSIFAEDHYIKLFRMLYW